MPNRKRKNDSDNDLTSEIKKLKRAQLDNIFYNKLKMSLSLPDPSKNEVAVEPSSSSADKNEILDKIIKIDNIVTHHKSRAKIMYSGLGCELARLKFLHFKKCSDCDKMSNLSRDIFAALKCRKCLKNTDVKSFFTKIKIIIGYSKSYVNYLIAFGKICSDYPKIKSSALSILEIRKHMAFLQERLKIDSDFWKAV